MHTCIYCYIQLIAYIMLIILHNHYASITQARGVDKILRDKI
jgi:hypothetical protein